MKHPRNPPPSTLRMWTVYDHPTDYPTAFVARLWELRDGVTVATDEVLTAPDLESIRSSIQDRDPDACVPLLRSEEDDPNIVEVWI